MRYVPKNEEDAVYYFIISLLDTRDFYLIPRDLKDMGFEFKDPSQRTSSHLAGLCEGAPWDKQSYCWRTRQNKFPSK